MSKKKVALDNQKIPLPGDKVVGDMVISDIRERMSFGIREYGTYLMTHNGRDPLIDAYQEGIDRLLYLRQEIEERKGFTLGEITKAFQIALNKIKGNINAIEDEWYTISPNADLNICKDDEGRVFVALCPVVDNRTVTDFFMVLYTEEASNADH
jgi:hypothetical protein